MARYNSEWEELGRNVQEIIDRAVNSQDYQKLNQTIRQTMDRAAEIGSEAVRKARTAANQAQAASRPKVVEQRDVSVLYGSTNGQTVKGILKIVGGSLLSCITFVLFLGSTVLLLTQSAATPAIASLAGLAGSVLLIGSGAKTLGRIGRFKTYRRTLGQKTHCTLEKLARSVGKNVAFVRKEVERMIRDGFFLEGHMDNEGTHLITSNETYRYFEQSRLQLEQRQQEAAAQAKRREQSCDPRVQEVLDKGNAFISQIRSCNDAIPGEEISAKISHMENIVQRIFERAQAHPEIVPDLKKMMDYYLPMTVKLLGAYADMDAQPVQGETIVNAKREIEGTLDTLNRAFEKLLDELFADTALDISSDISVLNTLLAQEGLTDDGLSKRT